MKNNKISLNNRPILSIVIVSYNTKDLLVDCLDSLKKVENEIQFETIIVDNASSDGSPEMVKNKYKWVKLIQLKDNLGFSKGNNAARKFVKGEYVLFLNSDTIVHKNTLKKSVEYLKTHGDVGSMTCKIVLPDGSLDKDVRRSFPTPWVALTHLVFRLDRLFPKSPLFAKYWYGYKSEGVTHNVDVIQGAFHLTRKKVIDTVGWFDEDYFLDGEDIDLCWRVKEKGWEITYYPEVAITHVKKASKKSPDKALRRRFIVAGVEAMELFYRKRMEGMYPKVITGLVIVGIRVTKFLRLLRVA